MGSVNPRGQSGDPVPNKGIILISRNASQLTESTEDFSLKFAITR